jgi:hypothetical protein
MIPELQPGSRANLLLVARLYGQRRDHEPICCTGPPNVVPNGAPESPTVKSGYLEVHMSVQRERLHEIVDLILEDRLEEAEAVLTPLLDPVGLAFLNAPLDDEEVTDEERRAVDEARAEFARDETLSLDEVMGELTEVKQA